MTRFVTPPKAAQEMGVQAGKVRRWIATGELPAANLAQDLSGKPRYRIRREDLDRFIESRMPSPPQPRKRRKRKKAELEYYG